MKFPKWKKNLITPFNLHLIGAVAILILNLVLGIRLAFAWQTAQGKPEEQLNAQRAELKTLNLENAPLRGLDTKIAKASKAIEAFYGKRIPPNESTFLAELGDLSVKNHVRLTRVAYTQVPAIPSLVKIRMDASLSGDYPAIMGFINGIERDKIFFVIDTLTLNGQQGGLVNLRLRLSTFLPPSAAAGIPTEAQEDEK
jgi:type IV pilus assembly protein PilO